MTTIAINGGTVRVPNLYAIYMYSPFPIIVESTSLTSVSLSVTCWDSGRSHTETRSVHDGRAEFDLSRIAQLLAPDVDGVFQMNTTQENEPSPYVTFSLDITASDGTMLLARELYGLYGALDQTEARFGAEHRRVWCNYPQTLQVWQNTSDEFILSGEGIDEDDFYPSISGSALMYEIDLWGHLHRATQTQELYAALISGKPAGISVSCRFGGTDTLVPKGQYELTLVPDLAPRGEGTYLRWLHRDGTFGYWHFQNGALKTDASQRQVFSRHIEGNPAEPVSGNYWNGAHQDFSESRQLALGALANSAEEYEYLCGLATSPVVDRLVTVGGEDRWQRVNVVPGSYARSMRRSTPNGQLFEVAIELPQRNTVTL